MLFNNYHGLFQEWEIQYAHDLVRHYQKRFVVLRREDTNDLMQECLAHWYFRRDRYDPSRAGYKTFMQRVIKNKLRHIIEAKKRNIRKALYTSVPMDVFLIDDDDDLSGCFLVFDREFEHMSYEDLITVLARAMDKLSRRQKKLCRLIKDEELNMSEVSERLKIPRATLFDEILRIREVFQKEGLKDYLKSEEA